jgi:hypothetical protein
MLLAAFGAIAVATISPASATTGGIVITHDGGYANVATGRLSSQSDQSATTLDGVARGRGRVVTNGGNNRYARPPQFVGPYQLHNGLLPNKLTPNPPTYG